MRMRTRRLCMYVYPLVCGCTGGRGSSTNVGNIFTGSKCIAKFVKIDVDEENGGHRVLQECRWCMRTYNHTP